MDYANMLFTFGIPALVIGSFVWRRVRPQRAQLPATTPLIDVPPDGTVLAMRAWLDYVNTQPDAVPHLAVIGPSGSGKTTLTTAVLHDRPGRIVVITAKEGDHWGGLPYVGIDDDATYATANATFDALATDVKQRLVAVKQQRMTADWMTIVVDDFSTLVKECPIAADVVKLVARLGRSLRVRLIMLSDSALVKAIGLEGEGETRANFAFLRVRRGHTGTLAIEDRDTPIDTSACAVVARQAQLGSRAWRPARDPEQELAELIAPRLFAPMAVLSDETPQTNKQTHTHAPTRIALYRTWRANGITRDQARAIRQSMGNGLDDAEWTDAGKRETP